MISKDEAKAMPSGQTLRELLPASEEPALITFSSASKDEPPVIEHTLTHKRLRTLVAHYAPQLKEIPLNSAIAVVMPNGVPFVVSFLAITSISRVAAPLNPGYTADEFEFYIEDAKVKAVVVQKDAAADAPIRAACSKLGVPVMEFPSDIIETAPETVPEPIDEPNKETIGLFLHTSGTTSRPKGVPLSHANLMATVRNVAATYKLTVSDRGLLVMPLFHVHGLMAGLLTPLATGGTVILPPGGRFSASNFWPCFVSGGGNWFTAVPTIHQILLARAEKDCPSPVPRLRFIRSCSASLAPAVLESMEKTFSTVVLEAYAMTEAAHQMTSNPLPDVGPRKAGSVGLPQGGVSLSVRDENGLEVKADEVGEVCVKGDNVMKGYTNSAANETAFFGEWFRTGDQGKLDNEGYLTLTGRIKELVNRGGEKISPIEVDGALLSHPAVEQAVCFAVPDEKYGEEVNAAVILKKDMKADEKEIIDFLKDKIAAFKLPKRLFFSDDLPRTATGKIQRRIVAKHFLDKLNAGE
ncbi:AMP-binding enzyme [Gracilaria domingensis]|nr:AMP-binding enzyme [Gracilaria domingensis]